MGTLAMAVVVILLMLAGCYILSGSAIIEGSIFERKTPVKKK
jgi:hypothetical protein